MYLIGAYVLLTGIIVLLLVSWRVLQPQILFKFCLCDPYIIHVYFTFLLAEVQIADISIHSKVQRNRRTDTEALEVQPRRDQVVFIAIAITC